MAKRPLRGPGSWNRRKERGKPRGMDPPAIQPARLPNSWYAGFVPIPNVTPFFDPAEVQRELSALAQAGDELIAELRTRLERGFD